MQLAYVYVIADQHRLNNERLEKVHEAKRLKELATKGPTSYIHGVVQQDAEQPLTLENIVAAVTNKLKKTFNKKPPGARAPTGSETANHINTYIGTCRNM